MKLHESGCFFFTRNGIFMKKLPVGVKSISIKLPSGRIVQNFALERKVFYLDSDKARVEIEMENNENGSEKRFFYYSGKKKEFIEVDEYYLIA